MSQLQPEDDNGVGVGKTPKNPFFLLFGEPISKLLNVSPALRSMVFIAALWLPLAIGTMFSSTFVSNAVAVPFLYDLEVHIRFLVALPLLLLAAYVAELWMPRLLNEFRMSELIPEDRKQDFEQIVSQTYALRNSIWVVPIIVMLVYGIGVLVIWRQLVLPDASTWYAASTDGTMSLRPVGYWLVLVSLPAFQVLLIRWYYHLLLWGIFLFRVARLDLHLIPSHTDRMGGLGFLSETSSILSVFAMVHGALLAGWLSTRVVLLGEHLQVFVFEIGAMVFFVLLLVLWPMLAFVVPMRRAKRQGIREYGRLMMEFEAQFEDAWVKNKKKREIGSGTTDLRDLSHMGKIYANVEAMNATPITRQAILQISIATLLPVSPLVFTIISLDEAMLRAFTIIFNPA